MLEAAKQSLAKGVASAKATHPPRNSGTMFTNPTGQDVCQVPLEPLNRTYFAINFPQVQLIWVQFVTLKTNKCCYNSFGLTT